jgi:hypothetical protein
MHAAVVIAIKMSSSLSRIRDLRIFLPPMFSSCWDNDVLAVAQKDQLDYLLNDLCLFVLYQTDDRKGRISQPPASGTPVSVAAIVPRIPPKKACTIIVKWNFEVSVERSSP